MVFRAADFEHEYGFNKAEKVIYKYAQFDDVARITVYLYADCSKEWRRLAKRAWASMMKMDRLKKLLKFQSFEHASISWADIYNAMVRDEVLESGGTVGYDEYGALGFINNKGTKHMGDSYHMFPFYGDYHSLKFALNDAEDDVDWTIIKDGIDYIFSTIKWDWDDFL